MPVAFQVDRAAATAAGKAIARRRVTAVTRRVLNRAIVLTPVDTGNLRAQNRSRIRETATAVTGEVFNDTAYGPAVHDGTPAYTIRPRSQNVTVRTIRPRQAKALRFVIGGRVVFAKSARVPMRPALRFTVGGRVVFAQSVQMPARRGRPWLYRAMVEVARPLGWKVTRF